MDVKEKLRAAYERREVTMVEIHEAGRISLSTVHLMIHSPAYRPRPRTMRKIERAAAKLLGRRKR